MFENKIKDLPKILYHYCSVDAFYKIVDSKCLWLMDAMKSNDREEIKWADDIVKKNIEKFKKDGNRIYEVKKAEEIYSTRRVPYIISFSQESDLLSQWKGYADNGRGVSIGFDLELLKLYKISPDNTLDREGATGISAVMYDKKAQEDFIKVFFDTLKKGDAKGLDLGIALSQVSYIFKNPHFKEECEYRIIHAPFIGATEDKMKWQATSALSGVCHIVKRGEIVSYFKLNFPKGEFVKEIILGPSCAVKERDAKLFLNSHGIENVSVRESLGSYKAL